MHTTFRTDSGLPSLAYINYDPLRNLPKYSQDFCMCHRLSCCHKSAAGAKEYNLNGLGVCKGMLNRPLGIGLYRYLQILVGMQDSALGLT